MKSCSNQARTDRLEREAGEVLQRRRGFGLASRQSALLLGALLAVEWPGRLSCRPEGAWLVTLQLADPRDPDAGRLALISTTGGATWTGEVL